MANDNTLQLFIQMVTDLSGGKLTQAQIEALKTEFGKLSTDGQQALGQLGDAHDQLAVRSKARMAETILAAAGLGGPVTSLIGRLEYIEMVAGRMGLSLKDLFGQLATSILAIGGASLVLNKAISLGKEADEAWEAAGLKAQGFWKNLGIGIGVVHLPEISGEMNFTSVGLHEIEQHVERIKKYAEDLGHRATVVEEVSEAFRPREEELAKRQEQLGARPDAAKLAQLRIDRQKLMEDEAAATREALYQVEVRKSEAAYIAGDYKHASQINETLQRARKQGAFPGTEAYELIEAGVQGRAKAAEEKQSADKKQAEQRHTDQIAAQEAIIAAPGSTAAQISAAEQEKARLESQGKMPGEQALAKARADAASFAASERDAAAIESEGKRLDQQAAQAHRDAQVQQRDALQVATGHIVKIINDQTVITNELIGHVRALQQQVADQHSQVKSLRHRGTGGG